VQEVGARNIIPYVMSVAAHEWYQCYRLVHVNYDVAVLYVVGSGDWERLSLRMHGVHALQKRCVLALFVGHSISSAKECANHGRQNADLSVTRNARLLFTLPCSQRTVCTPRTNLTCLICRHPASLSLSLCLFVIFPHPRPFPIHHEDAEASSNCGRSPRRVYSHQGSCPATCVCIGTAAVPISHNPHQHGR